MNKIKYTTALLLGGLLSFSSCTDNFADFNSTEGAYTDELQKYDNQTNLVPFSPPFRKASSIKRVWTAPTGNTKSYRTWWPICSADISTT